MDSPPKSLSQLVGKDDQAAKAENDALRKKLMEKKNQIASLEQQTVRFEEFKILLTRLIQDFQENNEIQFVEPNCLSNPLDNVEDSVQVVRNGVIKLIKRHENLASRFELEFSRNIFQLQQQLREKDQELMNATAKLEAARTSLSHQERIVNFLKHKKQALCKTLLMRRAALSRSQSKSEKEAADNQIKLDKCNENLQNAKEVVKNKEQVAQKLATLTAEKQQNEQMQLKTHDELLKTVENLRKSFQKESFLHNRDLSALDVAKSELKALQLKIDSYFSNLKTRELLDAENENKKLQTVIRNERESLSRQKAIVDSKGADIQSTISEYINKISLLNEQINQTEQKLQTQMMKIPDFPQLHQALDRALAQSKKYQEEVLQRKYLLDEIGDRNRLLDQMEIQASKDRMAQLKILMPLTGQEENDTDPKLHEILAERAKQQKEFEALLTQPGF
ncbi:hypothetical protein M9Y10_041221 [Tritrichomonas musculus]|uniref:Uncharacterized protein n=1 Tax=Tritrichomonas musculus TaxID=1915356 RepID=A0ABR2K5J0_9EUKA